ncbi:hypothetical protein KAU11_10725 [Candidatus Babeliales bacterium]|nr:hypothetical protein [Candidatus Babeliales bacterium]
MSLDITTNSILFLTRKKFNVLNIGTWVSSLIDLFQGGITHTAVVFKWGNLLAVREMTESGTLITPLSCYLKTHKNRIKSTYEVITRNYEAIECYNRECLKPSSYDFVNLLLRQPLRLLFNVRSRKVTEHKRICSEDTARCVNILRPLFNDVENLSPQEIYNYVYGH